MIREIINYEMLIRPCYSDHDIDDVNVDIPVADLKFEPELDGYTKLYRTLLTEEEKLQEDLSSYEDCNLDYSYEKWLEINNREDFYEDNAIQLTPLHILKTPELSLWSDENLDKIFSNTKLTRSCILDILENANLYDLALNNPKLYLTYNIPYFILLTLIQKNKQFFINPGLLKIFKLKKYPKYRRKLYTKKPITKLTLKNNKYLNNKLFSEIKPLSKLLIVYSPFFTKKHKITTSFNNIFWLNKFLDKYLFYYTKVHLNWQFISINLKKKAMFKIWHSLYKRRVLRFFKCNKDMFFYLLVQLIFFKNMDRLVILMKDVLTSTPIKRHRTMFRHCANLCFKIYKLLKLYKKAVGYKLYFKGKLGKKGSVRKSVFYSTKGKISLNTRTLRYNYRKFLVHTETGVIGCYLSFFY